MDDFIINTIKNFTKEEDFIFVFDILTSKNTVKNYTSNSNGIFFNLNQIDKNTIDTLVEEIKRYEIIRKENLKREEETKKFEEMIKTNNNQEKTVIKDKGSNKLEILDTNDVYTINSARETLSKGISLENNGANSSLLLSSDEEE